MSRPDFNLYLITDRSQTNGRDLLWLIEEALDAGVKAIQLREKDLAGRDLFLLAERASRLCQDYHSSLFVNDRLDIALAVNAAGVQLGNASMSIRLARQLLGTQRMVGVSTHSLNDAFEAQQQGADFVLFGPVYFTPSKATYGVPQGLNKLKEIVEKISLPVYAIGGINLENILDLRSLGVSRVALISAIMSSDAPKKATSDLLRMLGSA